VAVDVQNTWKVTVPKFHDLGNATENCACSSEPSSKSKTSKSGLPAVVSTCALAAQPFEAVGVIAAAGIHIVCLPAILTAVLPLVSVPETSQVPLISMAVAVKSISSVAPSDNIALLEP